MNGFLRGIRLLPIVLFATCSLLALKVAGMATGERLGGPQVAVAEPLLAPRAEARAAPMLVASAEPKRSWAQDVLNFPEVTGSTTKPGAADQRDVPKPDAPKAVAQAAATQADSTQADGKSDAAGAAARRPPPTALMEDAGRNVLSAGERAVLERLQERRQELDARAREMEIREGLLKAAEKRIESRIGELKELETQVATANKQRDEAEASRLKGIVAMYENMKPKEAARVFDRLEMRILVDVATKMNPRRMSDILAQMSPEAAEKLTVELASRQPAGGNPTSAADLPKIEGRPRG